MTVENVIPNRQSYRSYPQLVQFSTALGSRCLGGIFATDAASNNYNYAGDVSALYVLQNQTYVAVTRTASAYTAENWEFVNWGNTVIGVNGFTDLPQTISLGGTQFTNLSTGVKARHITTMRDFVVMGNVSDSATNVYRVRWSAINNPTSWTPDAATLADFQDLPSEGGHIQKVLGGEYGVILQQRSVWRMLFIGSPLIFQFDRIHNAVGAYVPNGCVRYQNVVYFLAPDGFFAFDGSSLTPIGAGKVDKFFLGDLNVGSVSRVSAVIDTNNKLVMWAYPSNSSVGGNPDKIMVYSWAFNRWTLITGLNIELLLQSIATGYTLDGLDAVSTNVDTGFMVSFDDPSWTGGEIINAAFNASHRLSQFNGSAMAVTCRTGEFQLFESRRARMTQVRPVMDGVSASTQVTVLNRNNLTESVSVGALSIPINATGFAPVRVSARYFNIELTTAIGTEFTHLMGVELDGQPEGDR